MRRLNLGCATDIHPGWVNLDRLDFGQEVIADLVDGLPFEDDEFDAIVANHSINGIRFDDLDRALRELLRVLKPDGTLRVLVPSVEWAYRNVDVLPVSRELEPTDDGRLLRYLFWHGDSRCAFTEVSLRNTLIRAGFRVARAMSHGHTRSLTLSAADLDSREVESLIVEAIK